MSARLLSGKPCAQAIYYAVKRQGTAGTLVTVGFDDPQWAQYTRSLEKSGADCGINVRNVSFGHDVAAEQLFDAIRQACAEPEVSGVLVEQPLPEGYRDAVRYVSPRVDVDCVNPLSVAAMYRNDEGLRPATPSAVIRLLDHYGIELQGKHVVIVGRGNTVGKPLSLMMLARNATVTVCHTKTVNLPDICRSADIIVSACGVANLITAEHVTERSVVIDVGLSFSQGRSVGDVAPEVYEKCAAVSPVPGGVGPVTRAVLFENVATVK